MKPQLRKTAEGGIILEVFLTQLEALTLAEELREMAGGAKPPRQPEPYLPLRDRGTTPPKPCPSVPPSVRAEIEAALHLRRWPEENR